MEPSAKDISINQFSERLFNFSIDLVGAVSLKETEFGAQDKEVIALALLCRTISNFKASTICLNNKLLIEASILGRSCYENTIWIGALSKEGQSFVEKMKAEEAKNRVNIVEHVLKSISNESSSSLSKPKEILRQQADKNRVMSSESQRLTIKSAATLGDLDLIYPMHRLLSHSAAHPSITALGRHVRRQPKDGRGILQVDVVPDVSPIELERTALLACDALLGACIGLTEILEQSPLAKEQADLFEQLKSFRKLNSASA